MTYILILKVTKFREDWLYRFRDIQQKPSGGHPPSPNRVKESFLYDLITVLERFSRILALFNPIYLTGGGGGHE